MIFQKKNIPNILTSSRILLIPIFLHFLFSDFEHGKLVSLIVFIFASITDAFDGFYARKYKYVSKLGIFLDPLADKLLVLSAFCGFIFIPVLGEEVKLWMIILILFRDVLVTSLRIFMEFKGITMVTSKLGKLKTVLQFSAIVLVLMYLIFVSYNISYYHFISSKSILYFCMYITTLVTTYTGIHYFYYNYKILGQFLFHK